MKPRDIERYHGLLIKVKEVSKQERWKAARIEITRRRKAEEKDARLLSKRKSGRPPSRPRSESFVSRRREGSKKCRDELQARDRVAGRSGSANKPGLEGEDEHGRMCLDVTVDGVDADGKVVTYTKVVLDAVAFLCASCDEDTPSRCNKCKRVYYCSRSCQKAHWRREHKQECGGPTMLSLYGFNMTSP